MTAIFLIALTAFSCRTTDGASRAVADYQEMMRQMQPQVPQRPQTEPVEWEEKCGGLWLSYDEYRTLEENIIEMRRYARQLEAVVAFYREELDVDVPETDK